MRHPGVWFILALAGAAGCSGSLLSQEAFDGRTRSYSEGLPDFDLEAFPDSEHPDTAVVHIGLIPGAMRFTPVPGGFVARYNLVIRADEELVLESPDSLRVRSAEETRSFERKVLVRRVFVGSPFPRRIRARLQDVASDQWAARSHPQPESEQPSLRPFPVRVLQDAAPLISLEVTSRESLEARAVLWSDAGACAHWSHVSVPTDSTVASVPFGLAPSLGSRRHRGALYDQADTVRATPRALEGGWQETRWRVPGLPTTGVHRVELAFSDTCSGEPASQATGRSYVVRPPGFPRITLLDQMIDALEYVATDSELEQIRTPGDAISRKEAFDAFWGRTIGDPLRASAVLERYYDRVEEANRLFSGYKEGWKTDQGMIYIVMGAPLYTEDAVDELRWFYSYDDRDPGRYFVFERVRGHGDDLDMPHYVLRRSMAHEREWQLGIRRWRRGTVR